MTGLPDDRRDEGAENGDHQARQDPLDSLLRPPTGYLPAPPGSFDRIRRRASRRRRSRAMIGGTLAVAAVTGVVYVAGALTRDESQEVVPTPANTTLSTAPATTPAPTTPPVLPPPGPPSTRPTPTVGKSSTSTTTTPSGASPTTPATPAGGSPLCTAAQLSASLGGGDAGAGNLYRYLVLTNRSGSVCHVTGFPGLSLLDARGKQIGAPATYEHLSYTPVVLRPGDSASDTIHTINQQGTCLATSTRLRIYPPGSKASLVFTGEVTNCDDTFVVTPFTAGTTGNPAS